LSHNPNVTDAANSVLIVNSNATAFQYNMVVRKRYFPSGAGTPEVGDRLMVCANVYALSETLMNGEMVEVMAIGEQVVRNHTLRANLRDREAYDRMTVKPTDIEFLGFDTAKVTLRFRKMQVRLSDGVKVNIVVLNDFLFSPEPTVSSLVHRALMMDLRLRIERENPGKDANTRKALLLEAIRSDMYFNAVPVKFGYAITCHKAQGGEWESVYANICTFADRAKTEEYFRWVYTALTRASKFLIVGAPYVPNTMRRYYAY
jgi:hypothetical protein